MQNILLFDKLTPVCKIKKNCLFWNEVGNLTINWFSNSKRKNTGSVKARKKDQFDNV